MLVGDVLQRAAGRLNDKNQVSYTNAVLLPHIADAWDELKLELDLHGSLSISEQSAPIKVPLGTTSLNDAGLLPDDMLEPLKLEERLSGSTDLFVEMVAREWAPRDTQTDSLRYWMFLRQDIKFLGATSDRDIVITYTQALFEITDVNEDLDIIKQSKPFLVNRTAGLAARFIGNNPQRADTLDAFAGNSLNKLIRIHTKIKQRTRTRRKPFRAGGRRRWV